MPLFVKVHAVRQQNGWLNWKMFVIQVENRGHRMYKALPDWRNMYYEHWLYASLTRCVTRARKQYWMTNYTLSPPFRHFYYCFVFYVAQRQPTQRPGGIAIHLAFARYSFLARHLPFFSQSRQQAEWATQVETLFIVYIFCVVMQWLERDLHNKAKRAPWYAQKVCTTMSQKQPWECGGKRYFCSQLTSSRYNMETMVDDNAGGTVAYPPYSAFDVFVDTWGGVLNSIRMGEMWQNEDRDYLYLWVWSESPRLFFSVHPYYKHWCIK